MWNDALSLREGRALFGEANPVFRLTGYFPYSQAHPYLMPDRWQALLDCVLPFVREHCDKIIMWDRPGAKTRRSKRITHSDWMPFHHLLSVENDVDGNICTGFSFIDRRNALEGNSRGPCLVRFFVGSAIRFEACIPLQDWQQGRLNIAAVATAFRVFIDKPQFAAQGEYPALVGEEQD